MTNTENKIPLVSIICVYYNREDSVERTLESIAKQTYRNVEVIIVDDGSTDNTLSKITEYSRPHGFTVQSHENIGFTKSLIKAISISKGQIIAIQGSGDISQPDRIEKQVNSFLNNPKLGLCGTFSTNISQIDSKTIDLQETEKLTPSTSDFYHTPPFTHGTAAFTREAYERAGGYNPNFMMSQDWDLWLRILNQYECLVLNEHLYLRTVDLRGHSFNPKSAERQLFFKYLALEQLRVEKLGLSHTSYEKQLRENKKLNSKIKKDLSSRMIKVAGMGSLDDAAKIHSLLKLKYGGVEKKYNLAYILIKAALKLKVPPHIITLPLRKLSDILNKAGLK